MPNDKNKKFVEMQFTTATQLRKRYERDLKLFQSVCPHEELTDWRQVYWAIGHSSDHLVQSCVRCEKPIHTKASCFSCGKEIIDKEIKRGDGKKTFASCKYCQTCFKKGDSEVRKFKK